MFLLNFSHPLTEAQLAQLAEMTGEAIPPPIDRMPQFDNSRPFAEQVGALADSAGLSPTEWQTARILINPPAFAPIASVLVAELHGRMGYFPTLIRLRPVAGSTPPVYEVAELLNLQAIREQSRQRRRED